MNAEEQQFKMRLPCFPNLFPWVVVAQLGKLDEQEYFSLNYFYMKDRDAEKSADELERDRSLDVTENFQRRTTRPLVYAMSRLLVNLSYAIVVALVLSLLVQAFMASAEVGIKSLAAAALPPLVITYLTLFTRLFRPQSNIPDIALFLSAAAWIIAMLVLVNFLGDYPSYGIPFGVFALSTTLSGLIFINKYVPFSSALSSAFGIVVGVLIYTLLFGFTYGS